MVQQDTERGKYRLGFGLVRLARRVNVQLELTEQARPLTEELARTIGESINVAVLREHFAVNVVQSRGQASVVSQNWIGQLTPLHATSSGKVLLAHLDRAKQAELVAAHIAKQDIVITTALIPGRPAPKLVTRAMVESMKPGSVIVDLAVERGGNCEAAAPGQVVEHNGVKIVGHLNVPGRLAATASSLYAKNLYAFVETLVDKETKELAVKWDDELVKATCLTRDGAIVHTAFQPTA